MRHRFWMLRDRVRDRVFGSAHREAIFNRIHSGNLWSDAESVSGAGSNLAATARVRQELPHLVQRHGVRSMLDAPCGDFYWMKDIADCVERYVGVDIVPAIISRNISEHGAGNVSFLRADIARDALPPADLVMCRDCFIHLPTRLIESALQNFQATGARFLLLTNCRNVEPYHDIAIGGFRPIDFARPPFSFAEPLEVIEEDDSGNRQLALWELQTLRAG